MTELAVVIPVGPGPVEAERFYDTAQSLCQVEPAVRWLIAIDDDGSDRGLREHLAIHDPDRASAPSAEVVVLRHPLPATVTDRESRITAGLLTGLRHAADHTTCDVAMKVDTDALAIAPFAGGIAAALSDESIGMIGSYERDPNGNARSFRPLILPVIRAALGVPPKPLASLRHGRRARRWIRESRKRGYRWGEHVLGCTWAMPRRTLDALRADGVLDDAEAFTGLSLYDDPIIAVLVRRAGFRLSDHTSENGGFGISWRGLPDTPERLVARGFSIIHSVKNDPRVTEAEVRAYFRRRRATAVAGS